MASRALHFAAAGGATDVAHYLLSKGCSADAAVPWEMSVGKVELKKIDPTHFRVFFVKTFALRKNNNGIS